MSFNDMDIYSELEAMADAASRLTPLEDISTESIARWQRLFNLSEATAREQIECFHANLSRQPIPDDFWASIASRYEALDFDKEAYEYSLTRSRPSAPTPTAMTKPEEGRFLLKLDHLLTLNLLQNTLNLTEPLSPMVGHSTDEPPSMSSSAVFVEIDGAQKPRLLTYLATHEPHYRPTIIKRTLPASKNLSDVFDTPRLGFDVTLPHHRPHHDDGEAQPRPRQDGYPVWYFFYGTLREPERLGRLLGLGGEPELKKAVLCEAVGRLGVWGGRYRALVDGEGKSEAVAGQAFLVKSMEHEDVLREYETDQYEVVRCDFVIGDGEEKRRQRGLTFRFRGGLD